MILGFNLTDLLSDASCYTLLRQLRWKDGVYCPNCESQQVIENDKHATHMARQCYACKSCSTRFDDLTGTDFSGAKVKFKVWIGAMYLLSLNVSTDQIAKELDVSENTTTRMVRTIRQGVAKKKLTYNLMETLKSMKFMS